MKFSKSVLAISIALVVAGGADAAAKQKDDDSVHRWGRWAVLMPAAGLDEAPGLAAPASNDLGSCQSSTNCPTVTAENEPVEPPPPPVEPPPVVPPPIEPPPVVEGHCVAGAACGYATYEYSYYHYGNEGYGDDGGEGAPVPGYIDLNVQFTPSTVQPTAIGLPPADRGEAAANFTITPKYPHAHYPPITDGSANGSVHTHSDGAVYWYASQSTYSPNHESEIYGGMFPSLTENTTAGHWCDGAEGCSYYYGDYWSYGEGDYVAGTTTTQDFLDGQNAGNVEAHYDGFAMASHVPVEIDIDFGASTWSGTWNGGRDGDYVSVDMDENNVTYVEGQIGFRASGHLSGPNIVSDSVSADDAATVTGSVEGSFFGSEAQVLGGVSDITKTVTTYTLIGGGGTVYNNARNVDVFVTVKEDIAEQVGETFINNDD